MYIYIYIYIYLCMSIYMYIIWYAYIQNIGPEFVSEDVI